MRKILVKYAMVVWVLIDLPEFYAVNYIKVFFVYGNKLQMDYK